MIRHSVIAFAVVAMLSIQPFAVQAQEKPDPDVKTIQKQVERTADALDSKINDLNRRVDGALKDIGALNNSVGGISSRIHVNEEAGNIQRDENRARLEKIEAQLKSIMADLEQHKSAAKTTAKYPPQPTTNSVILVNSYDEDMIFTVNDKSYPVRSSSTVTLTDVPLGIINYKIASPSRGIVRQATTTVNATETLSLRAFRQQ